MNIVEAQRLCLQGNIPFYSYRLPGGKDFFWGAQLDGEIMPFQGMNHIGGKGGFVLVPFRESKECPALFIKQDLAFVNSTEDAFLMTKLRSSSSRPDAVRSPLPGISKEEYHRQVTEMITALKQERVLKMVLSRSLLVECKALKLAPVWFMKLADAYPEAFVFLVSVPGVATWMGATPEIFLNQEKGRAETMALAGTRIAGTQAPWGTKEIEEQQIVSRYIGNLLKKYGGWEIKECFSKQAGKVEHLCTSFVHTGCLSSSLTDRVRLALHPTPAVGGFPSREAVALLSQIEGYERRYYAGYLGPVGWESTFHWFVNLRCMELFPHAACLYVGGGITALSDPDKEWEETEMKSRTLLDIIS